MFESTKTAVFIFLVLVAQVLQAEFIQYFKGVDDLHLMVSHSPSQTEIHFFEKITSPDGTETTLIDGTGPVSATPKKAMAGSSVKGLWKLHVDCTYTNSAGTVLHDISDTTFINDDIISGTMLFDETIGGSALDGFALGTIYVNSGITLTLNTGSYTNGNIGVDAGSVNINGASLNSSFYIGMIHGSTVNINSLAFLDGSSLWLTDGTLTILNNARLNACDITIEGGTFDPGNAANFTGCNFHYKTDPRNSYANLHSDRGNLWLEAGSEGAQISGTNYWIELWQGDVMFNNAEQVTIRIFSDVTISGGLFDSHIIIGDTSISPLPVVLNNITLSGIDIDTLSVAGATSCEIMNCEIGTAYIAGGSPDIHDNSFADDVTVLYGGDAIKLTGNTFHGGLTLAESFEPRIPGEPTISGNDFMGPSGISYDYGSSTNPLPTEGSIHIGNNYYGSPKGPATDHMDYKTVLYGMMGDNGAQFGTANTPDYKAHYEWFDISSFSKSPLASGAQLVNRQPHFWVAGWGTGQGVLNWYPSHNNPLMYKGVNAIVVFDIRSSMDNATADCYLENITAGTTIQPKSKPTKFTRLLKNRALYGSYSVVFEVPPPVSHDTVHFKLHLVDSDNHDSVLTDNYLYFTNSPWSRSLKIAIVPVKVDYWFSSKPAPSASSMQSAVTQTIPAIFPIPPSKLTVDIKPKATMSVNVGLVTHLPALGSLAFSLAKKYVDVSKNPYDIVIAVMPKGTINPGGDVTRMMKMAPPAAGVNFGVGKYFFTSSGRVLLVDATQPMAFLHELGHAAGLYRSTEQYDMPEYVKTEGKPLSTFSAAALRAPAIIGFPRRTGIVNFPPPKVNWYNSGLTWLDVMGLAEENTWPDYNTHDAMLQFLVGLCSSSGTTTTSTSSDDHTMDSQSSETDSNVSSSIDDSMALSYTSGTHIVVGGPSVRIGETVGQYPVPQAWAADAAALATVPSPPPSGANWYQYAIMRFMNGVSVITNLNFDLPSTQLDTAWWSYSFPMPAGCNHVRLLWYKNGETLVGEWESAGTLSVNIDESTLSTPLNRNTELSWSISASSPTTNSHIYSQIAYSLDNGSTWIDWYDPVTVTNFSFDNEFLPISSSIALRVTVSDGFSMARDTVTGLQVIDRTPTVTMLSPRTNDVALADTAWPLQANAIDVEDGNLPVSWSSSRDGALTTNTILTVGAHILTVSATDSHANTAVQTVPVKVVNHATDIDLTIDSFKMAGQSLDLQSNWLLREKGMHKNTTNFIQCIVRNSGICTTGRLDVTIYPPSGNSYSWSTNMVEFDAFTFNRILVPVIPSEYGNYRFAATLTPLDLPDRNMKDNFRTYSTYTESPVLMLEQNNYLRQEVLVVSGSYYDLIMGYINENIYIHNGGSAALTITNINLISSYSPDRLRVGHPVLPVVLQPDERLTVTIQYYDTEVGRRDAILHIDSDDPGRPHLDAPLYCWDYDSDTNRIPSLDPDDDRLPNYVENIIGTDTNNADTDGDGIIDGYEDYNGNGILDPRETSPLLVDTDGDGLPDGAEDSNHNGGMDGQETAPWLVDTDNDSLSDFEETITKTSPLDSNSKLAFGYTYSDRNAGESIIRWQAKKGVHYRIEQSNDLVAWSTAPSGSGDDYQADITAAADSELTYRHSYADTSRIYYRIVVIP